MYASWMRDAHNRRVASLVRVLVCSASWALAAAAAGGKGRPVRIAALARVNLSILGSLLSLRSGARFLEEALPEQCRDERGAASNPAPTNNAVLVRPSSPCQAGFQAVVLDLRTHLHYPPPAKPVVEVVVHPYAPLLLGRVRPGTEVTIGTE